MEQLRITSGSEGGDAKGLRNKKYQIIYADP